MGPRQHKGRNFFLGGSGKTSQKFVAEQCACKSGAFHSPLREHEDARVLVQHLSFGVAPGRSDQVVAAAVKETAL